MRGSCCCDNMSADLLRATVEAVRGDGRDRSRSRPPAASRSTVAAAYAATGVDYLSVGALTHSSPILDIALDLDPEGGRQPTKMQKG